MKLTHLAERPGAVRRSLAALAVAGLGATLFFAAPQSAHAIDPNKNHDVVLGVGADATSRTLAWYSATADPQQLVFGPASTFAAGTGTTTVDVTPVANYKPAGSTYEPGFNAHATLTNLLPNTQYAYKVGSTAGGFSTTFTFKTSATDFGAGYSADFFGDPQIGASGQTELDGDGWVQTVKYAQSHDTGVELYLSGGDQIDTSSYTATEGSATAANKLENQWDQFTRPFNRGTGADITTGDQIPWVATIGNHDVGTKTYMQHLATPNLSDDTRYYAAATSKSSTSGGNYWFNYRGVLYIDLNSNSYSPTAGTQTGDPAHVAYVRNVVEAHGADAKYTVLMYHHSIYSPADHANDGDNAIRRNDFTKVFSDLGVDLVLQGHDHAYTRSYAIKNGARTDTAKQLANGQWGAESSNAGGNAAGTTILPGPGGVIYATANSSSGSKYYDLTEPDVTKNGGDYGPDQTETSAQAQSNTGVAGGHTNHWANAVENQEHVQSYINVSFGADKITVSDIRSGDCVVGSANAAVQRGNVGWCGNTSNTWSGAVNDSGVVDTDADGIYAENVTPAAPTSTSVNDAYSASHGRGSLVDLFTIQQFVAPTAVTVSGTPTVGQTLTATPTGSFTLGTTVAYAWEADGVPFATGPSATLTQAEAGKRITAKATGTLTSYAPVTVASAATAPVAVPATQPGTLVKGTPVIEGKPRVGEVLNATTGDWTAGTALTTVWIVDGKQVQTGGVLKLTKSMQGTSVSVEVYGSKTGFTSASATSSSVKVQKAKKTKSHRAKKHRSNKK